MNRDLDWECIEYHWRDLPIQSRLKILAVAIKFHAYIRLRALSRFRWALLIEGVMIATFTVLAIAFHDSFFSLVAGTAIGLIAGGTLIFWLSKDIPRE